MPFIRLFIIAGLSFGFVAGCDKKKTDSEDASPETVEAPNEAEESELGIESVVVGITGEADKDVKAVEEALTKSMGVPTTVKVLPGVHELLEAIRKDEVTLAVLDAWPYYAGHHRADLTVVAAEVLDDKGAFEFEGAWFVRKDSELDSVTALKGKRVAFGAPNTAAGFLFAAESLLDEEVLAEDDEPTQVFGEVHMAPDEDTGFKMLVESKVDALAAGMPTYEASASKDDVRVLKTFGPIPSRAIAVKSMSDEKLKEKVAESFSGLSGVEGADAVLGSGAWKKVEHFEYAESLQRASEKTRAEYPPALEKPDAAPKADSKKP